METKDLRFLDVDCLELTNARLTLRVTKSMGPRVIYLALPGGKNILAEVPDFVIPPPVGEPFRILGGHRVWHGPEVEMRTYLADDKPLANADVTANGVRLTTETDAAGIQKTLEVILSSNKAELTVIDTLQNNGKWPVETYPWGLTQVRSGGFGILPQTTHPMDQYALISNRAIVLWPYTRVNDPRLQLGDRYLFVKADPALSDSFKIGFANRRGWLGYYIDRTLFVKHAAYEEGATYSDMGSSSEIYTNDLFMELECLGPMNVLEPGKTVSLTETWTLFSDVDLIPNEDKMDELVQKLGLDN